MNVFFGDSDVHSICHLQISIYKSKLTATHLFVLSTSTGHATPKSMQHYSNTFVLVVV